MTRISALLLAGVAAVAVSSAAHAADLIINEPAPTVGVVESTNNWDGAFVGVFAGTAWGTAVNDPDGFDFDLTDNNIDVDGWLLGVDAGVNFTLADGIVAGIVGDIAWTDQTGTGTIAGVDTDDLDFGVNWQGSVRGRLGFDGGAFMPYLTAGLAFANATVTQGDYDPAIEDSQTLVGWTAGAGIEFAATDNVSIDLQYRYNDFGNADFDLNGSTANVGLTSHQVTAGVHFSF